MQAFLLGLIYLIFFISGAVALVYQIVWVRSFGLVFGGSHLAVTTVLSTFMGGLALGGYVLGRYADRTARPLRLYGLLEIGIAFSALVFWGLMKIYPAIYTPLASGLDNTNISLSIMRVAFAVVALIVPTTLMGGTLPVLSRYVITNPLSIRQQLSTLYGLNTFGAVVGTAAAAFFLLPSFGLKSTLIFAIAANLAVGFMSLLIDRRSDASSDAAVALVSPSQKFSADATAKVSTSGDTVILKLVLCGIGASGFCALGYEVLWTRVLCLSIGASVYGFATMLITFLAGIALGSMAYGWSQRLNLPGFEAKVHPAAWFGCVQLLIGLAALLVTFLLRDLQEHSINLQRFLSEHGFVAFHLRQINSFILAFSYMVVPAFFMGVAFPLAGRIYSEGKRSLGEAIGHVLSWNTVGAILGAAVSGYLLLYLFGIERSLQMLIVINLGIGLLVLVSLSRSKILFAGSVVMLGGMLLFLAVNRDALFMWDLKKFAVVRVNQQGAFGSPEVIREAMENTDLLFYHEGIESTTAAVQFKGGGEKAVLVNGKAVASTFLQDRQCQYTLGHLPMLLHPNPRKVFVLGLGTGMTLGAVSVHPQVEKLTLAEIEPKVTGAARTFADYNHNVLDNPKLQIVANDGRNFLLTTTDRYDVITADPIHPWAQGAAYLYTTEYFKLASERLEPGGIMCQWLPIYELSVADLQSVVRTFGKHFRYTMLWLTHYDAEIIGSNEPLLIDERLLDQRIRSTPAVRKDLEQVFMGSAEDFLSYFVMASPGMQDFSRDGIVNTDDNLYLEFSAPLSIAVNRTAQNALSLAVHREDLLPYLVAPHDSYERHAEQQRWGKNALAGRLFDEARGMALSGLVDSPRLLSLLQEMRELYPEYAPARFLNNYLQSIIAARPRLLQRRSFAIMTAEGVAGVMEIAAVISQIHPKIALIDVVDSHERKILGQLRVGGLNREQFIEAAVTGLMDEIEGIYLLESKAAQSAGGVPHVERMRAQIETLTRKWIKANSGDTAVSG